MKTIEQAAQEKIRNIRLNHSNIEFILSKGTINGTLLIDMIRLFKEGVEFAQRWIPIEDDLPKPSMTEIVHVKGIYTHEKYGELEWFGATRLRSIHKGKPLWEGYTDVGKTNPKITHWRYIELK
jgi:hypothetical protein